MSKSANDIFDEMRDTGSEVFFEFRTKHPYKVQWLEDTGEVEFDLIPRLSRKLRKAAGQSVALRKYARHKDDCLLNEHARDANDGCTCGLEELLNPKRQEPI